MAKFRMRNVVPGWDRLEYALLRILTAFFNFLPIGVSTAMAALAGELVVRFMPKRKKVALENLDIAYAQTLTAAEKEKLARQSIRHVTQSLFEFFRFPVFLKEARDRVTFEGTEHLDLAFSEGKGVILVISHLGSWEYLACLPYLRGYPCSVIVRETRNPYVYEWIQNLRKATRLNPIDRNRSVRQILAELKQNHLVAILIDQWAGPSGLWIDFFGKPTSTTSIPARLAEKTGAALVPAYCVRESTGRYKIVIRPRVALRGGEEGEKQTTQELNRLLEETIRRYPEQWTWSHRRWKDRSRYSKEEN